MCLRGRNKVRDPHAERSEEVEEQLREDARKSTREVKVLLLGAGESGKSTVMKQMRLLHNNGYSSLERKRWMLTIFDNLLRAFQYILYVMEEQEMHFSLESNIGLAKIVAINPGIGTEDLMVPEHLDAFKSLWKDDGGVQGALRSGNEYALHDNIRYYMSNFDRLFAKDSVPTDQDIIRARVRTTGISETQVHTGNLTYRMVDVGGQRSERKKWIHVFDNVHVVVFLVAISGYDEVLLEDHNGNRMREALMLFESIANCRDFENSILVLFLNKIDLFREKVASGRSPISQHFPDYEGGEKDIEAGQSFFAHKFTSLVHNPGRKTEVHFTNATDGSELDKTIKSVQAMVMDIVSAEQTKDAVGRKRRVLQIATDYSRPKDETC
jgi:guanine nucleotide-binding protein subunit alpha